MLSPTLVGSPCISSWYRPSPSQAFPTASPRALTGGSKASAPESLFHPDVVVPSLEVTQLAALVSGSAKAPVGSRASASAERRSFTAPVPPGTS